MQFYLELCLFSLLQVLCAVIRDIGKGDRRVLCNCSLKQQNPIPLVKVALKDVFLEVSGIFRSNATVHYHPLVAGGWHLVFRLRNSALSGRGCWGCSDGPLGHRAVAVRVPVLLVEGSDI